jgi:hypothetical protein
MNHKASLLASCATVAALILAGCGSTTKLTNVWTDPTLPPSSIQKVMVVAVAQNASGRRMFEDTFASALQKQGVQAISSYSALPGGVTDSLSAHTAMIQNGCDGVFVTRIIDQKTVDTYYPPTSTYVGTPYYGGYYGGWYGYYNTSYAVMTSPGYTVENEVIHVETNLYREADSKLVWAALSESWLEQASDKASEIQPYVNILVERLVQSKVVGKAK